jgi:hypothetical protein
MSSTDQALHDAVALRCPVNDEAPPSRRHTTALQNVALTRRLPGSGSRVGTSERGPTLRPVSEWQPVITGVAALLGAGIGGGITFLTQRADRKDRARGELAAAIVAFGYALDSLHTELSRMSRPTRVARLTDRAINEQRFPGLNRLLIWANSKTIGRDAERAVDRFMSAANRLMVLAPLELLPVIERANQLLSRSDERDDAWEEQWWAVRAELTVESRKLLGTRVIDPPAAARSRDREDDPAEQRFDAELRRTGRRPRRT